MSSYSIEEVCQHIGSDSLTEKDLIVKKIASLKNADSDSISFFTRSSYAEDLKTTKAKVLIMREEDAYLWQGMTIIHPNPYLAYAKLTQLFNPHKRPEPSIDLGAIIGKEVKISKTSFIGPFNSIGQLSVIGEGVVIESHVSIGSNVHVGDNTYIHANVTIGDDVVIGGNCEIYASASIGTDGFGYAEHSEGNWEKIMQTGSVIIGNNVDIGSNTVIDRGAMDDTIIQSGVKIDNQVQIGHNCNIGENTIIAGCVGIAGSAIIGKECKIGGAAMILGHLRIADKTTVSPGTMITKSITKSGEKFTSIMPFLKHSDWLKFASKLKQFGKKDD